MLLSRVIEKSAHYASLCFQKVASISAIMGDASTWQRWSDGPKQMKCCEMLGDVVRVFETWPGLRKVGRSKNQYLRLLFRTNASPGREQIQAPGLRARGPGPGRKSFFFSGWASRNFLLRGGG